jgi:hypothetical protein
MIYDTVSKGEKEAVEFDDIQPDSTCSLVLEFSGLWFAKKAFGPAWNVVQVRLAKPDEPDQETFDETYPDEYMFEDDQ